MVENKKVRVRFAPSPTGKLHMGSARTALFNYLFAKKEKGVFILRIEDTDIARSDKQIENSIINDLKSLGITWDEFYRQSERFEIYKNLAQDILARNKAYYCFCTPEELETAKKEAAKKGQTPKYSRRCKNLSEEEKRRLSEKVKPAIRFEVPDEIIPVNDVIRGIIQFDPNVISDFIILKSDGTPSYNFAAAVDDSLMEITHVIRGEDHLSNTARQVIIYKELSKKPPIFAHIGLILGPDKTKLSKRHGETSVGEYIDNGYLPEAIVNFLSLLGWSSPDGKEIFLNITDVIDKFSLDRLSPSPAIFDIEKLTWLNGEHIRSLSGKELSNRITPFLKQEGLSHPAHLLSEHQIDQWFILLANSIKDNLQTLADAPKYSALFFVKSNDFSPDMIEEIKTSTAIEAINLLKEKIEECDNEKIDLDFNIENSRQIFAQIKNYFKEKNIGAKEIFHPLRIALSFSDSGPQLPNLLVLLGREKVLKNLNRALNCRK